MRVLKTIGGLFLILVLVIVAAALLSDGSEPSETADEIEEAPDDQPADNGAQEAPQAPRVGIGDRASDGQFTFVVDSYECGDKRVGQDPFDARAQGVFCKVRLTVENTGDASGDFFPSNQYLLAVEDDEQRELAASDDANFAVDPEGSWQSINPGNSVKGQILFDVAERLVDSVVAVRLHDSAFSSGVIVSLEREG